MPNGNDLATKQLATGQLTWMLATIQMSGTSTYWALPERTNLGAKSSIQREKSRCDRFNALKQATAPKPKRMVRRTVWAARSDEALVVANSRW